MSGRRGPPPRATAASPSRWPPWRTAARARPARTGRSPRPCRRGRRASATRDTSSPTCAAGRPARDGCARRSSRPQPAESRPAAWPAPARRRRRPGRSRRARRLHVADHLQAHVVVADLDALDGAAARPACRSGSRLLRTPARRAPRWPAAGRRARGRSRSSCHVDEQPQALVPVHPRGQRAGDDVPAHIGAQRGEQVGPRTAGARRRRYRSPARREHPGGHHERRHAERLGVDAERDGRSRRVACQRNLVDLGRGRRRRPRTPRRPARCESSWASARSWSSARGPSSSR